MSKKKNALPVLVQDDAWLEPYVKEVQARIERFDQAVENIKASHKGLKTFAKAYQYFGITYSKKDKGWYYREWAPAAKALFLIGDFNDWNREATPLERLDNGVWQVFLPKKTVGKSFGHQSLVKVHVVTEKGGTDRIPAYIRRAVQDPQTHDFTGQVWWPEKAFEWTDKDFDPAPVGQAPIIYEAHVGMAQEAEGVGTYRQFADEVLPRIKALGYNCVQLMAVQEHPYYGSFGYHVSNFFAPSSRFGTPEDLKFLVNKAHEMGLAVIMDLVHSHAVKNLAEGLNNFDGSEGQYFHEGGRGYHTSWDSKLFNYGKPEVQQFLLANVRYWLEEFHFDGYRFDGVTSMLYFHHGDFTEFDHYDKYFKDGVEWDALTYLQLANDVVGKVRKGAFTIAEDMSGMPGMCRKPKEGGVGFDFRLGMGLPDFWIKYLKEKRDEDWDIHEMWGVMTNRRWKEKTIAYAESHDQAIVGDKTVAFWLMDKEMYWHMQKDDPHVLIDRGMALHKMIRLFTLALGGEGYLNFIGNEFGHPEWIDFPRQGNDWSYKYARRQWSLVDNPNLKYQYLNGFDGAMVQCMEQEEVLRAPQAQQLNMDTHNKTVIFERGNLIFLFNFHPSHSVPDYAFHVPQAGSYQIVLDTDAANMGGHGRVAHDVSYEAAKQPEGWPLMKVYLPSRTALVLKRQD